MTPKLLLPLLLLSTARAQSPQQVLQWINTPKAETHDVYEEIPFEYRNGSIVIRVTIGDDSYQYIFDTGGYNDITDDIQAKKHFPILTTETVGSSNRLKAKVNLVKVDSLKIGSLLFRDVAALQMNFHHSPTIGCTVDGALIGASIIHGYCWQIDYEHKKIIVTDHPDRLPGLGGSVKVPVAFNSRLMPFVMARLDGKDVRFMFDLGSSSPFILTEKNAEPYAAEKQFITIDGVTSEGGNGVIRQTIKVFKVDSLQLAGTCFRNTPVYSLPNITDNLIGNPIIKHFLVTLDFPDSAIYLTPTTPPKGGLETYGFSLKYDNGKTVVGSLYEGSAADRSGLRIGDTVTSVNGQALTFPDPCAAIPTLAALIGSEGDIELTILRDRSAVAVRIAKEKLF
ncbi:MAG TPA: aspartyl protease family protein [Dinghuibacter sp.]|uniref:aspartyl protease family protein n=1 Tax=Dinghuibacter sp. TaxID=2024697 RepID=UPI002C5D25C2|nr:aspartyl protease family protein [Dinghuibacter sp.]HTJ11481.1 aspartyl protease family protein [Dinghuibacter sp.]